MQVPPAGFTNLPENSSIQIQVTGTAVSFVSLYLIMHIKQLDMEMIQPHTEVSSSLRISNIRSKPLKRVMCPRDSWRKEWQIMITCPSIAVFLIRFAAKFSTNGCFFSCDGSLPYMDLQSPWCIHDKTMNHRASSSDIWTNISHHHRRSILDNTPTGHTWFFFHRRHLYTISVYTLKEVSSFRTRQLQVLSQNFVVTNSLIFHSFGNPVACNMHGSQDDKALISRLLLLQRMCHSQPAIYKPRSLSLVWKATWSPQFEKGRNTSYYIKALIHN